MTNDPRIERLMHIERVAGASRLYDSRIEIWAARTGIDPRYVRGNLNAGYSFSFVDNDGYMLHRINPDEVR